ncbi:HET-domain-containing protein [Mollisia scopiformis]|uniref:HET-domain-containing protein n=1 Tax=Mollisia scopiformis TaxID=149040 RepID=A0A194X413_MOLSC|nr:HET-domain-containing protein [Mollisia scopiformis]KUJ14923.1 HET-domain-containing protein [Mollisia scopiformis]
MPEQQIDPQNTPENGSLEEDIPAERSESEEEEEMQPLEYTQLDITTQEMRFLTLEPAAPDTLLKCSMSIEPLEKCKPYTYIINTRGNPISWLGISIDGKSKHVTRNICEFLAHIRSRDVPQRLWFRDVCINHQDSEEKSRYWNQEWMDTMIKHAEKVVDLSEVMAELWDKGELPRPFPRTAKDWSHTRQPKETKHHPCPLQMQKGWVDPPPPHQYLPLDYVADEFRLVVLWKAENYDDPLRAALAYSVMHDDVAYHCLSYTWGSSEEEPTCPILLNGQTFMIRKNLDRCLRELRDKVNKSNIWIDAICIDQNNIPERNRQIPRMLEIYEAADVVLSWIGEGDEASDTAIDFLDELKSPKLQPDDNGNWGPYTVKEDDEWKITPIPDLPQRLAALYRLFLRPYFRRIWVIQELAVANLPSVYCGKKKAAWSQLDMAAYHLLDILHRDRTMPARMMAADPLLKSVSDQDIWFVRKLFYFRHLRSRNADHWLGQTNFSKLKENSPGILDALILGRDFESTAPHDKVFALLNLAQDIEGLDFKLDYLTSLSQTYQEFATAVAEKTRSLDIICAAENSNSGLDMPTWSADWSTPSKASSLVRREHIPNVYMWAVQDISGSIYHTCGPTNLTPRFSFNNSILEVAGLILDSVKSVHLQEDSDTGKSIGKWMSIAANALLTEEENQAPGLNMPFMEKFWSMLAGDVTGVWSVEIKPTSGSLREEENENVSFRPVCVKEDECKHRMRNTSADVFRIVTRGRALIITENGLMGLAPENAKPGQRLGILSKCSVPVLLGENEDGSYTFKGSAFVQGWMEGEALEDVGMNTEEAWEVLDESGRLKIV